jgi:hypothetical protein
VREQPRAVPVEDEESGTAEPGSRPDYAPGNVIVGPHPCFDSGSQIASNSMRHRSRRSIVTLTASFDGVRRSFAIARSMVVRIGFSLIGEGFDRREDDRVVRRGDVPRRL